MCSFHLRNVKNKTFDWTLNATVARTKDNSAVWRRVDVWCVLWQEWKLASRLPLASRFPPQLVKCTANNNYLITIITSSKWWREDNKNRKSHLRIKTQKRKYENQCVHSRGLMMNESMACDGDLSDSWGSNDLYSHSIKKTESTSILVLLTGTSFDFCQSVMNWDLKHILNLSFDILIYKPEVYLVHQKLLLLLWGAWRHLWGTMKGGHMVWCSWKSFTDWQGPYWISATALIGHRSWLDGHS